MAAARAAPSGAVEVLLRGSNLINLSVTVCHYPPGASQWNPIDSFVMLVNDISTTSTKTGLRVKANLDHGYYQTGVKTSEEHMAAIRINRHKTFPDWCDSIRPAG